MKHIRILFVISLLMLTTVTASPTTAGAKKDHPAIPHKGQGSHCGERYYFQKYLSEKCFYICQCLIQQIFWHFFHKLNISANRIQTFHMLSQYNPCRLCPAIQWNMQRKFITCICNRAHNSKFSSHKKLFIADNHAWSSPCLFMFGLWTKIQKYNITLFRIIHYHTSFPTGEPQSNSSATYSSL